MCFGLSDQQMEGACEFAYTYHIWVIAILTSITKYSKEIIENNMIC